MSAVLMDTNALIWFANGDEMLVEALNAIANAQHGERVYVSPISAWEAALASKKKNRRPNLGGRSPSDWFGAVLRLPGIKLVGTSRRIALEAAEVPPVYGSGDPGDCFLIATARIKRIPIVTRDAAIIGLSESNPRYLKAIPC
jgi:PIN domain nuclease of toxin-antitoxin system